LGSYINNLRFFNGNYPYDYYIIRYTIYFVIPFLLLLVGHSIVKRKIPLTLRIDEILNSASFPLQLYIFSGVMNFAFITTRTSDSIIFDLLVAMILVGVVGSLLWFFSRLVLRTLSKIRCFHEVSDSTFFALFKCMMVVGIITAGLFLTISSMESPWTSIQYFSCR
jgi:hypothetical protein